MAKQHDVHNEAMLVGLTIGYWRATRQGRGGCARRPQGDPARRTVQGRYTKFLVDREAACAPSARSFRPLAPSTTA